MAQNPSEFVLRHDHDPNDTVCECLTDIKPEWVGVGFPGQGLVGNITAKHIIKEMDLEWMGSIRSPYIPPVAVFIDGVLAYPYRIYGCREKNFVLMIGESPCPPQAYYYIARALLNWAINVGAKQVVCFDGFSDSSGSIDEVYLVAEPQMYSEYDELKDLNFPKPHTGFISGLSGAILNEALLTDIIGYSLLVPIDTPYPNPGAAAKIVQALSKIKKLDINIQPLLDDAERIKTSLMELADRNNQMTQPESVTSGKGLYL